MDTGVRNNAANKNGSRIKKKSANRARHRLLSIRYDVEHYLKPLLQRIKDEIHHIDLENSPIVANERCGTWYAWPFGPQSFCHFKSTDGHVHLFSLKRLNLEFLRTLSTHGSVILLDASNKKEMPDSFSRTLPIWACVLNRISQRYRRDLGREDLWSEDKDYDAFMTLHVPDWIVTEIEREAMESIIEIRVEELYQSQAIVDIPSFVELISKPLRPYWITPLHSNISAADKHESQSNKFHSIICCNASNVCLGRGDNNNNNNNNNSSSSSRIVWRDDEQFWYTPGAADDHESWARHLTPLLFWEHAQRFSADLTDQQTEDLIDSIVAHEATANNHSEEPSFGAGSYDWIENLNIAIGTRRSGRPPDCWGTFDAILNVTNTEYDNLLPLPDGKAYLQLPVEEGKRDKQELERWLPVGIMFCAYHAKHNRRILIHCAQGRDRSVAVAMAVVQIFCPLRYPLEWDRAKFQTIVDGLITNTNNETPIEPVHPIAELPQMIGTRMFGQEGRDILMKLACQAECPGEETPIATKETLRVVLYLIRQDREKAEPTRSTMQKLNRFFMSKVFQPPTKINTP